MSNIISGKNCKDKVPIDNNIETDMEVSVTSNPGEHQLSCHCASKSIKLNETEKVGSLISNILQSRKGSKAIIRLKIEFTE